MMNPKKETLSTQDPEDEKVLEIARRNERLADFIAVGPVQRCAIIELGRTLAAHRAGPQAHPSAPDGFGINWPVDEHWATSPLPTPAAPHAANRQDDALQKALHEGPGQDCVDYAAHVRMQTTRRQPMAHTGVSDDAIKECIDAIDFKSMVTADDLFYLIARSVLEKFAPPPEVQPSSHDMVQLLTRVIEEEKRSWTGDFRQAAHLALDSTLQQFTKTILGNEQSQPTQYVWIPLTRAGQVKVGDKLRFTLGGAIHDVTAKQILHPGKENEEIIYNKRHNYYLITSMAIQNTGSQKNVMVLTSPLRTAPAASKKNG